MNLYQLNIRPLYYFGGASLLTFFFFIDDGPLDVEINFFAKKLNQAFL